MKKTKWMVWNPKTRQFVGGDDGNIRWTFDRAQADDIAKMVGGEVKDAEAFLHDFNAGKYDLTATEEPST